MENLMLRIRQIFCLFTVCLSMITSQMSHGITLEPEAPVIGKDMVPFLPILTEGDPLEAPVAFIRQRNWELARNLLNAVIGQSPERAEVWEVDGFLKIVENDMDGADASLRKAIKLDPKSASAMSKLGHVELTRDRIEEARHLFEKALSIQPEDPLANLYLGRLAARSGNFEGAIERYETAVAGISGSFTAAQGQLASLYNQTGRYDATIELLTPLATPDTNDAAVFILLATAYLGHGDTQSARQQHSMAKHANRDHPRLAALDAMIDRQEGNLQSSIAKLREILERDPTDDYARYELGQTLLQSGDWRAAIVELEIAAAHLADPYQLQLQVAEIRLRAGDTEQAIADLERLRAARSTARVLYLLAGGYRRTGDVASSLRVADSLVAQFPDYMPGYLLAIQLKEQAGEFDKAVATARWAVKGFPQQSPAWIAYSGLYLNVGQLEPAKAVIEEALRHLPGNVELKFQLASTHQQLGEAATAERLYRELLKDNPNSAGVLNNLSNLLAEDPNRGAEALKFARRAHWQAPNSGAVEDTLGWALHLNGDNAEAATRLQSALEKNPADGGVLCRLGIVYSSLNRVEQARQTIERCLVMSPGAKLHEQAQAVLDAL
jgi:tetratricopeptide (TPR) repeat protein